MKAKTFKRGYVETTFGQIIATLTKVKQTEDYGVVTEDEDDIKAFSGWKTIDEAREWLRSEGAKEIITED